MPLTRRDSVLPREEEQILISETFSVNGNSISVSRDSSANSKPRRKGHRKFNVAMSDPIFVRKRTAALLAATKDGGIPSKSQHRSGLKIGKKTFDWLIDAWAYSSQPDSTEMALQLLNRMEQLQSHGHEKLEPNVKTYTKVIRAVALSPHPDGALAEQLLNNMTTIHNLSPNTMTYTYVIDAYSRSSLPEAPQQAKRLIETMETLRQSGQPIHPTARAYNSLIRCYANDPSQANACLDAMEQLASSTNNQEVRPNSINCNSVIAAWAKSGNAVQAELVLHKMERLYSEHGLKQFQPQTDTYNAIIDAYAKSGELSAPNRAELLLGYMMELYDTRQNIHAKPNVLSFNSVMNAWAKSGDIYAPERALEILDQMEKWVEPDVTSFATVIHAYARSMNYGKAEMAYELYGRMKSLYISTGMRETLRPNAIAINSVLNACAFTVGDIEEQCRAMEIANDMFRDANERDVVDEVTYGTYLKVICNQMPRGRQRSKVVRVILDRAIKSGMVGKLVLKQVKEVGLEAEVCAVLFGRQSMDGLGLDDLPSSWSRNVVDRRKQRGQQH